MNDGFKERRQDPNSQAAAVFMQEVKEDLTALRREVAHLDRSVTYYRATQDEAIEKAIQKAIDKSLKEAFPNGDPDGHRRHHEAVIKAAEERAKFWSEMRTAGAKWAGLGVLGFIVTAIWVAVKTAIVTGAAPK